MQGVYFSLLDSLWATTKCLGRRRVWRSKRHLQKKRKEKAKTRPGALRVGFDHGVSNSPCADREDGPTRGGTAAAGSDEAAHLHH